MLVIIFSINYSWLDSKLQGFLIKENHDKTKVLRIIDGDTIETEQGKIRLLGINAPETTKKEKYSQEAKDFLEKEILNKTVTLEYGKYKTDRYKRTLAYIFLNKENINLKLVKEGLANYYFPSGKDIHYQEFKIAWENCIKENKNLCKKSDNICSNCIKLKEFDYNSQEIVFENICSFDCNLEKWDIKDEGRKHFSFPNVLIKEKSNLKIKVGEEQDSSNILYWRGETYVWTRTGDSLFLRDDLGKLVLWESY